MGKQTATTVLQKGKTYTVTITGLGHSGEGVGRYEGFTVFVPQALPGETVTAVITEVKKTYAKGRVQTIVSAADGRVAPPCSIYERCGGCQLQHLTYAGQLAAKRQTVVDAVQRIGKLENVTVHPTLGMDEPWYYRNKMQFPVGQVKGELVIGCFAQGTHTIIPTDNCLIQEQANNRIISVAQAAAAQLGIAPYDEVTGKGVLRHVIGRVGHKTGEVMVVLVTATRNLPQQAALIAALREGIPGLVSVVHNVNSKRTNVIMGEETHTLWGSDTITDALGDLNFRISARSFFQVNTLQAEVLYEQALKYAGLTGSETVIDAYCGTGTITLFLAQQAAKVYGIEIVAPAIRDAKQNAADNAVTNAEFIVGDATAVMPELYEQGIRPDVVVVDPPRAGCERPVLETFAAMQPKRIVYVSCSPASLARDLGVLDELGYVTKEVQPVDMFPHTYHVENVALIERK